MSQLLLPLLPSGATVINGGISVFSGEDVWTYFSGLAPIFSHSKDDLASFRMFTAALVDQGTCRRTDIVRCFGVSLSSVKRSLKKFREQGAGAFFAERMVRGGTVFTPEVLSEVQDMLNQGATREEICEQFSIKRTTLKKAVSSGRLRETAVPHFTGSFKSERSATDALCELGTACHRTDERVLAALGELNGAATTFESCCDLKFGGVLCALPFLEANGLFNFIQNYFTLPQGYYTELHIVTLLAFMALCRIRTIERLRFEAPGELGKLLGIDRIPEVKTLRSKIAAMCNETNTKEWMLEMSRFYMQQHKELAGVLYIDGHVRIYNGTQTTLPRRFVSRQRLCLRGTTDYYVNDALGQPFFVISKTVNEGMIAALETSIIPQLLQDIPGQPTDQELDDNPLLHRFIIVVDREASSRKLFKRLWDNHRIACISYRKNSSTEIWNNEQFEQATVSMPAGETVNIKLSERGTYLGTDKDGLWVKEIRKLTKSGHQTSIITTGYLLDKNAIPAFMFSRWSQENFFGYMMDHYNLDRIIDYDVEDFPDPEQQVVNPVYRSLNKQVTSLNAKLNRRKAEFASIELDSENGPGKMTEKRIAAKADLREDISCLESELQESKEKRKQQERHICFKDLPENEQFKQLAPSRKTFIDTVKMVCYRSETAMANTLKLTLTRTEDARRLACEIMRNEVDLRPDINAKQLHIIIHRSANPQSDRAVSNFLKELNETETFYPGTDWKLHYSLAGC